MNARRDIPRPFGPRSGMTLLEVLVACGILVVGLASLAALLPAAGFLLAEAAAVDRGASLAANAAADLRTRGILAPAAFQGGVRTLVVGDMFPDNPFNQPPFRKQAVNRSAAEVEVDRQAYGAAAYGATASLLDSSDAPTSGVPVRVAVVVVNKEDAESKQLTLDRVAPGVYKLTGSDAAQREADRKRFLPGCSWAVAVNGGVAHWLHVGSSWAMYAPGGRAVVESFVSFSDPDAASAAGGGSLTVHGFSGVLRVEERVVPLQ